MSVPGVHHVALRVQDCAVSARFYAEAFGLREIRRIEAEGVLRAVWLRAGETVVMLERALRGSGQPSGSGHVLIFPTLDLQASETRLQAMGVRIADRTASTLYVEDPDGHRAGVSTYRFNDTGA